MLVIKVGGGKELNIDAIVADVAALLQAGRELILVHGGAETTNEVAEALGHPAQFVTSESGYESRRTDRRTLEIFEMVYCGQLNKMWVEETPARRCECSRTERPGRAHIRGQTQRQAARAGQRAPACPCATTGPARSSRSMWNCCGCCWGPDIFLC